MSVVLQQKKREKVELGPGHLNYYYSLRAYLHYLCYTEKQFQFEKFFAFSVIMTHIQSSLGTVNDRVSTLHAVHFLSEL